MGNDPEEESENETEDGTPATTSNRSSTGNANNSTTTTDNNARSVRPACPFEHTSIYENILFSWALPLLQLGTQRPLQEIDLPTLHFEDTSVYNKLYIEKLWNNSSNNGNNSNARSEEGKQISLGHALLKDYFKSTRTPQLLLALNSASKIGQAVALGMLMEQFTTTADDSSLITSGSANSSKSSSREGYIYCAILILCGLITFPTKQHVYYQLYRKGMRLRVGLVALLYDKSLRLSSTSSGSSSGSISFSNGNSRNNGGSDKNTSASDSASSNSISAGKLTNLASNDVERFLLASIPSLYMITGPMEAVVILIIGIFTLGPVSVTSSYYLFECLCCI